MNVEIVPDGVILQLRFAIATSQEPVSECSRSRSRSRSLWPSPGDDGTTGTQHRCRTERIVQANI